MAQGILQHRSQGTGVWHRMRAHMAHHHLRLERRCRVEQQRHAAAGAASEWLDKVLADLVRVDDARPLAVRGAGGELRPSRIATAHGDEGLQLLVPPEYQSEMPRLSISLRHHTAFKQHRLIECLSIDGIDGIVTSSVMEGRGIGGEREESIKSTKSTLD